MLSVPLSMLVIELLFTGSRLRKKKRTNLITLHLIKIGSRTRQKNTAVKANYSENHLELEGIGQNAAYNVF